MTLPPAVQTCINNPFSMTGRWVGYLESKQQNTATSDGKSLLLLGYKNQCLSSCQATLSPLIEQLPCVDAWEQEMKWELTTARKHWNSQGNEISQQPCELKSIIFRSLAFKWDPRQDVIAILGSTLRQRIQLSSTRHQSTTWELVDLC